MKKDSIEKKNILFFFSTSRIGGTETNFLRLARDLSTLGFKVHVLVVEDNGPLLSKFDSFACDIEIINIKNLFNIINNIFRFRNFIIKNKINVVFNCGLKVEIFSRLFSKVFGIDIVISNIRSTDDWRRFYHTLLDRITHFGVDLWVSNSLAGVNAFHNREKINLSKAKVIYNYIDDFDFDSNSYINIESKKSLNIGILSNIKFGKGFEDLILICENLILNGITSFSFIIAGVDFSNGRISDCLKKSIYAKHFKFIGFVSDKEAFFDGIDIFLLPTYWEGFPTSVLESMYFGTPVISTSVGGIPEMINNRFNGILLDPGDTVSISKAIFELSKSNELYNMFRVNSYNLLKNKFTKGAVLNLWLQILK